MLEWLGHRHFQECREMVTALHSDVNLAMQQVHAFFRGPVVSMAFGRNLGPQIARDRNQTVRLDRSAPIVNAQRKGERYYERAVTKNFARVRIHTHMLLHEDSVYLAVSIACSSHQSDLICSMHTCTIPAFFIQVFPAIAVASFSVSVSVFLRQLCAALSMIRCYRAYCIIWPWDGLKLSHARTRPGSNPGLPRAISRLFARAPGRVACWVSGGLPFTNCMCIPPRGARPKL
jgi:hypothetical protein